MRLYIIRHGQSSNNALANQRDRVRDPLLTPLGQQQVELVAQHLVKGTDPEYVVGVSEEDTAADSRQSYNITRLYCSAMHRALLTARPISEALGLQPEVWVDIHEHGGIFLDHGGEKGVVGYPGKNRSEISSEFPDYIVPEDVTEDGWWNPELGMEDRSACHGRAIRVVHKLKEWAASDRRIAIVSHGGFMSSLLKALTDNLPSRNLYYHHYNTAISRIDFRPDGSVGIRYINRFDHLPPDLIS